MIICSGVTTTMTSTICTSTLLRTDGKTPTSSFTATCSAASLLSSRWISQRTPCNPRSWQSSLLFPWGFVRLGSEWCWAAAKVILTLTCSCRSHERSRLSLRRVLDAPPPSPSRSPVAIACVWSGMFTMRSTAVNPNGWEGERPHQKVDSSPPSLPAVVVAVFDCTLSCVYVCPLCALRKNYTQ